MNSQQINRNPGASSPKICQSSILLFVAVVAVAVAVVVVVVDAVVVVVVVLFYCYILYIMFLEQRTRAHQ